MQILTQEVLLFSENDHNLDNNGAAVKLLKVVEVRYYNRVVRPGGQTPWSHPSLRSQRIPHQRRNSLVNVGRFQTPVRTASFLFRTATYQLSSKATFTAISVMI